MAKHTTPFKHQYLEQMPEDADGKPTTYGDTLRAFWDRHPEFDTLDDVTFAYIWGRNMENSSERHH